MSSDVGTSRRLARRRPARRGVAVSDMTPARVTADPVAPLPAVLAEATFEAVVVDWDGAAVPHGAVEVAALRARVEALCAAGVHVVVVSGQHVGGVDRRLAARPVGPGRLHLSLDRGDPRSTRSPATARRWRGGATPRQTGAGHRSVQRCRLDRSLSSRTGASRGD